MNRPFFSMINVHVADCGTPPAFSNDRSDDYHGYFENRDGEQWVFTYDRATKKGELRGGDAGWERVYAVIDGRAPQLVLSEDELRWLDACWDAAARN